MVSCSLQMSEQKLTNIDREKNYRSAADALLISSDGNTCDITDDPLLRYFRAGVNKEGYWTSSHAKLQLEDCMDCLMVIFPILDFDFYIINIQATQNFGKMDFMQVT